LIKFRKRGFTDQNYFDKRFKEHFGISPRECRETEFGRNCRCRVTVSSDGGVAEASIGVPEREGGRIVDRSSPGRRAGH
jgi:hypothetical protein